MRHMTVTLFLSSNYKVHSRRQEKQKFCKEDQKLLVVVGEWNRFCCGSIFLSRLLESNHFFITHHLLLVLLLIAFNIHVLGASKVKSVETDEPIFELIPPLTSRQLFTSSQALDEADADAACVPLETSPNHDWLFWLLVLSCWSGFIFFGSIPVSIRWSPYGNKEPELLNPHMETVINHFHMVICQSPFPYWDPRMVTGIHLCWIPVPVKNYKRAQIL